jgi:hypothetical protein
VNTLQHQMATDKSGGIINAAYFPVNTRHRPLATDESGSIAGAKLEQFFESARAIRENG